MHDPDLVQDYGTHYAKNLLILAKKYNMEWYMKHYLNFLKTDEESVELYKSVVEQNEYQVSEELLKGKTVVDVGANRGIFSIYAASLGASEVIAFEPVSSTFNTLHDNIIKSEYTNIQAHQKAVSNETGNTVRISLNPQSGHNSLFTQSYQNDQLLYEEVGTISLHDVIKNISNDIFLKLDCEGSEYDILLNLTPEDANKIKTIVLEIHEDLHPIYKGSEILISRFKDLGYEREFTNQVSWWTFNEKGEQATFDPLPLKLEMWKKVENSSPKSLTETSSEIISNNSIKYSIVIPTYNHCDDLLKPCVDSIFKNTDMTNVELIISANGCTDNTATYLSSLKNTFDSIGFNSHLKIVWNDAPLGYSKACNVGIKVAIGSKVILLNNDATILDYLPKNEWINLLEKPFFENSTCGLSAPSKQYCEHVDRDFLIFYCVMIDRKVFDQIGLLSEDYGVGAGEDTEFCVEAEKAGFTLHQCDDQEWSFEINMPVGFFPIFHPGEGTVHDQSLVTNWTETFVRNSLLLEKKYKPSWRVPKIFNHKKIGVITSVYNGIQNIIKCVDSVKSQSIDNVFHYIYDDGSIDKLDFVMEIFSNDSTTKYFNSEKNNGLSYGRNFALNQALNDGCEIIAFLDVDDRWNTNHLQDSLLYLNDNDVVYSFPKIQDLQENDLYPTWNIPEIFDENLLYKSNFIWISSVVAKSTCFVNNKFDEKLTCYEDWDMWLKLHENNFKFYNKKTQTITYVYNQNTNWGNADEQYKKMIKNHHQNPKTLVIGFSFNETVMMPYFIHHYSNIADKIIIIEGNPNYQYQYLTKTYNFEVDVIDSKKLDDFQLMELRNYYWRQFKQDYDYIIVVDIDEFLDITRTDIKEFKQNNVTLPVIQGYQMVSLDFPENLGEVTTGFADSVHMNKQVIFRSTLDHINYFIGCHSCSPIGTVIKSDKTYNLYHYKYIGFEQFKERSKKSSERLSENNKNHGWGTHYAKDSEITKEEFQALLDKCYQVKPKTNIVPNTDIVESLRWLEEKNQESEFLFNEVIIDNVYNVSKENIKDKYIIDIGANMGMFSLFAATLGAKLVLAVEPVSSTIDILEKNIKKAGFNNIKIFKNVVTDVPNNDIKISLYEESGHNGIYNIVDNYETVKSMTLSELLSYTNGQDVYLKLDCEGAEYDIIMTAAKEDMDKIAAIGIEIHSEFHPKYKGTEVIRNKLASFGFKQQACRQMGVWYDNNVFEPGSLTIEYWSK